MLYAIKTFESKSELLKKRTAAPIRRNLKRKIDREKLIFKTATPEQMIADKKKNKKPINKKNSESLWLALIVTTFYIISANWTMIP